MTEEYLSKILDQIQQLDKKIDDVSLNQQRNSVRIELLESRRIDQVDRDPYTYGQSVPSCAGAPNSGLDSYNALHTLADCAAGARVGNNTVNTPQETNNEPGCPDFNALKLQADSVRDRVKSVGLPGHLVLPSTQGIKVADRKRAAVLRNAAGYTTTCMKLIKQWENKQVQDQDVEDLFCVLCTQMRQLQVELNEIVLESNAPKLTMDYFRYLSSNNTALSPSDYHNFEMACNWTVASQRAAETDRRGRPPFRGRSNFRGYNRGFRGRYSQPSRMDDILNGLDQSLPTQNQRDA